MEQTLRPFRADRGLVDHALFEDSVFDDHERVVGAVVHDTLVTVCALVVARKIRLRYEVEALRQYDAEDLLATPSLFAFNSDRFRHRTLVVCRGDELGHVLTV